MPRDPGRVPRLSLSRRGRVLVPTLIILVVLGVAFALFSSLYTELLWFRSVGFSGVFSRRLAVHIGLFVVFGLVFGASVAGNALLAYRLRPAYIPGSAEQQSLDRYRMGIDPLRRLIVVALGVVLGILAGLSASSQWKTYLLWRNGSSFGQKDPQFGLDVSFFVFDLPWYRFVLSFAFSLVVLTLIAAALTHYLYGGVRLQGYGDRTSDAARVHLSVLLGIFVLLKAVAYFLDRYSLAVRQSKVGKADFTGLTYTDINALLPAKTILAWVALICAVLFFANIVRRTWLLPALGLGSLLIAAVLIGGLYPALFQQFRVKPSEADREAPQIARNITETLSAYRLDAAHVKVSEFAADPGVTVPASSSTEDNIRLVDPYIATDSFVQFKRERGYYRFVDPLDVDRYEVDGKMQEMVVGVREVDVSQLQPGQKNWNNEVTAYTHGYGFFAAATNRSTPNGDPSFASTDNASDKNGTLGAYEPRVYFGEYSPAYSVVGAPKGSAAVEIEAPTGTATESRSTYTGGGGVAIGSTFRRALYALKYRDSNLLLSSRVNSQSRILDDRSPRERVEKAAPWLTVDGDPYPAVVDGRIEWILDGYTSSASFPYSTHTTLDEATTDSVTATSNVVAAQAAREVNYIRNSVKATVDAYTGEVHLYQWDEQDPVLRTWMKAFPETVEPRGSISADLLPHLRYPEDLFKVQRDLYTRYHVTNPGNFYQGSDYWRVPSDPSTQDSESKQPPYYLTLQMPGQDSAQFALTSALVPNGSQNNLSGFISADSNPSDPKNYGNLRVLRVTGQSTGSVLGPQQVHSSFTSAAASGPNSITLLQQGGTSKINFGNLLTLPVQNGSDNGFLYVEPVYVRGSGEASFPRLQRVLVGNGQGVGFETNLASALAALRDGGSTSVPPPTAPPGATPAPTAGAPAAPGTTPSSPAVAGTLAAAIAEAQSAFDAGQAALRANDFAAYGEAQKRLQAALVRIEQLNPGRPAAGASSAKPTPAPTPAPTG